MKGKETSLLMLENSGFFPSDSPMLVS